MSEFGTVVAPDTVRIERVLPGPVERIWSYLTDPEMRRRWFCGGEMEQHVGGQVELIFHNNRLTEDDDPPPEKYACYGEEMRSQGRITQWQPNRLLAYTWAESASEESEVRFELESRGEDVHLVIIHSRLANRKEMIGVSTGWHAHLGILEALLDGREPEGFWRSHSRLEAEYQARIN